MRKSLLIPIQVLKTTTGLFDITQAPDRVRYSLYKGDYALRFLRRNPYASKGKKVVPLWIVELPDGRQIGAIKSVWQKMQRRGDVKYGQGEEKQRAAQ